MQAGRGKVQVSGGLGGLRRSLSGSLLKKAGSSQHVCRPGVRSSGMIFCMQGLERADRQLLDAQALVGHLVPAGSMFAFLAAHRAEVFPDADYADLFSRRGWAGRRFRRRRWRR